MNIKFFDNRSLKNIRDEIWRPIMGWEKLYHVSNYGRVKSLERFVSYCDGRKRVFPSKILKQQFYPNGYLGVELKIVGVIRKSFLVHRLVGKSFLPNPDNKPELNHKRGNKLDNRASKLEWCFRSYNIRHAIDNGLMNIRKRIIQKTLSGRRIRAWKSGSEIKRRLGFSCASISSCCTGKYKKSYGYLWAFEK
jgi:hypothetical protein